MKQIVTVTVRLELHQHTHVETVLERLKHTIKSTWDNVADIEVTWTPTLSKPQK